MIKLVDISFSYGDKKLLENFFLEIKKNDRVCLFGKSGCGKTTILRLILGLEKQQSGEILIEENIKMNPVFQEDRLLPFKTVLENITLFGAKKEDALFHLKELGIAENADMLPDELSGGMKRKAAIARALANDYDVLILDEAFTGLDQKSIQLACEHILKSAGERPIIMITHIESEANLLGAKIVKI